VLIMTSVAACTSCKYMLLYVRYDRVFVSTAEAI
jgi:hypothetical protein